MEIEVTFTSGRKILIPNITKAIWKQIITTPAEFIAGNGFMINTSHMESMELIKEK